MSEHVIEDPRLAERFAAASAAQRRGDRGAARQEFERMLEIDPGNALAHNALGMDALARNDLAEAEQRFKAANAADPSAPALWMNLATTYRRKGDDEGERKSLLGALDLDQRHFMANIRLAELHERRGEKADAAARWNLVLGFVQLMQDRPAGIESMLAHAQAFVAEQSRAFGEAIESGLEPVRAKFGATERRRFEACVDTMLGRRRIYHNQCAGLHFPFLPADEFFERSHFPWMAEVEAQTDIIRDELEALIGEGLPGLSPYVSMDPGTPANKWSPLDKSLDWGAYFLWHQGERKAEACDRCPRTAAILTQVPQAEMPRRAPTAFFSLLRPRTRLPAHTGVSNARTIIHLPLIVPPGCGFRVGGETREWKVGEAFAFDDTIEHEAWNDSDQLRAVLIFDVWNPYLTEVERELIKAYFEVTDASGFAPSGSAFAD
jgi:aspartate beta-hydroxylase